MSKTDEIREGLKTVILSNAEVRLTGDIVFKPDGLDNIIRFLKPRVWLKTERELPKVKVGQDDGAIEDLTDAIGKQYREAGYHPVEELEVD